VAGVKLKSCSHSCLIRFGKCSGLYHSMMMRRRSWLIEHVRRFTSRNQSGELRQEHVLGVACRTSGLRKPHR